MILYHGSNVKVEKPLIIKNDKGRDFGFAFYVTPIKEQAERWAKRKVKIERTGVAIVSVFEFNENNNNLKYKKLNKPNLEWLELIIKCRTDLTFIHGFDIVEGKIADDSVGETILFVLGGIISKDEAIKRLKFQKINSQIAFCTLKSLEYLNFIKSYEVE